MANPVFWGKIRGELTRKIEELQVQGGSESVVKANVMTAGEAAKLCP